MSAAPTDVDHPPTPAPRRRGPRAHPWRWASALLLLVLLALAVWFVVSLVVVARTAPGLRADVTTLEQQAKSGDFEAAASTMGQVREKSATLRSATSGLPWAIGAHLPVVGGDVDAVRALGEVAGDVTDAARPVEGALPALAPARLKADGGAIDTGALSQATGAMPLLAQAVDQGAERIDALDVSGLHGPVRSAVESVRGPLDSARDATASAGRIAPYLPAMLGADGKRTYFVMLEQDAEARGTGGLVGAYAVVTADKGKISLVETHPRAQLQDRPVPAATAGVPAELQDLWGTDLTEWAGLNLSPHFPWTGRLVAAGWDERPGAPKLDGVVGIDGSVVQALLAGTGPIQAGPVRVSSANAAGFLARDVYRQFPDPDDVDAVTGALVQEVFAKVAAGQVDAGAMLSALRTPYEQRRLTVWSSHSDEQEALEGLTVGGTVPSAPGPFVMSVVNNGGGNKLDAYLEVATHYEPGTCQAGVRIGTVTVDLTNTAPVSGLPDYVSVRSDLKEAGQPNPVVGSNRVLLDLYTAAGSQVPLVQVDGQDAEPLTTGFDVGKTVTRVAVVVDPGKTREVTATVVVDDAGTASGVTSVTQPMVLPATTTVGAAPACTGN